MKLGLTYFGIMMEPNKKLENVLNRFWIKKIGTLNLYNVKFKVIKNNITLFNEIFPNFFLVKGYKKLVLESNNKELKCYHIAQEKDEEIVSLQETVPFRKINNNDIIMFCLEDSNNYNKILEEHDIYKINLMSIISNKSHINFDFGLIKTFMI